MKALSKVWIEIYTLHVLLTTPKVSSEKLTLIAVEMQQLPDKERTGPKEDTYWLKRTKM